MVQCVLADIAAHPAVTKGGGLTLKCDDGELSALRDVFVVSSPLIEDLLSTGSTSIKVSGSIKDEWLLVISQLYPIVPRPELSLQQLQQVLPVVHKYNFSELLQFVSSRLATELPSTWSLYPSAPGYIIKWLVVKAHPSVVKRGEVTLECDDGGLSVLRNVFVVSSPRMADLLGEGCTSVKARGRRNARAPDRKPTKAIMCAHSCPLCSFQVSGSTKEEWLLVISQLYPIVPRPELSLQQLQQVLPVVHKLDALEQAALEGLKKQPGQPPHMIMESNVLEAYLLRLSPWADAGGPRVA
ncbi:BTB domain-containing protein [Haematococcus lacustris]|uniref:BTB domain-containing protein n=1 Tax=Haematococcus lacustris TaxID=44745 RepID=A0A699YES7_HAELA|nr:BTB domain-containing protein [Haematococcus lacustris]